MQGVEVGDEAEKQAKARARSATHAMSELLASCLKLYSHDFNQGKQGSKERTQDFLNYFGDSNKIGPKEPKKEQQTWKLLERSEQRGTNLEAEYRELRTSRKLF